MRDPKLALFGIILLAAGAATGYKANLATQARDQFDAHHKAPPAPAPLPSDEEDRANLMQHMELGQTAQVWWIVTCVVAGAGLLLILTGLIGKSPAPKSPV
jgi:hypothetical protein